MIGQLEKSDSWRGWLLKKSEWRFKNKYNSLRRHDIMCYGSLTRAQDIPKSPLDTEQTG